MASPPTPAIAWRPTCTRSGGGHLLEPELDHRGAVARRPGRGAGVGDDGMEDHAAPPAEVSSMRASESRVPGSRAATAVVEVDVEAARPAGAHRGVLGGDPEGGQGLGRGAERILAG